MQAIPDWQALLRGDKAAWDRFVIQAAPVVRSVARRVLEPARRNADLPDVVQDTFVALCRDDFNLLKRFDPAQASLSTYLGVIASRRALDWLRRHQHPQTDLEQVPEDTLAFTPPDLNHPPDLPLSLPRDLLTPRQTLILRLLYERDMDVAEIALRLGIAAQSVRSMHHKALERLRACLGTQQP